MAKDDEADRAYQAALALIEEVRKGPFGKIDFSGREFNGLNRIPAEVKGLKWLAIVDLSNTQVSDLSPLSSLKQLSWLDLRNSKVRDLTPLAALTKLARLDLSNTAIEDIAPLWLRVSDLLCIGDLVHAP